MRGKEFPFYGLKQEKGERKILFPIIAEFLFPQFIDWNILAQVNFQWTVSLGGRGLQVSKTTLLIVWFYHQEQPLLLGNLAFIPRSRAHYCGCSLDSNIHMTVYVSKPVCSLCSYLPSRRLTDVDQHSMPTSLTKSHNAPQAGSLFPVLSLILNYCRSMLSNIVHQRLCNKSKWWQYKNTSINTVPAIQKALQFGQDGSVIKFREWKEIPKIKSPF